MLTSPYNLSESQFTLVEQVAQHTRHALSPHREPGLPVTHSPYVRLQPGILRVQPLRLVRTYRIRIRILEIVVVFVVVLVLVCVLRLLWRLLCAVVVAFVGREEVGERARASELGCSFFFLCGSFAPRPSQVSARERQWPVQHRNCVAMAAANAPISMKEALTVLPSSSPFSSSGFFWSLRARVRCVG